MAAYTDKDIDLFLRYLLRIGQPGILFLQHVLRKYLTCDKCKPVADRAQIFIETAHAVTMDGNIIVSQNMQDPRQQLLPLMNGGE